MGITHLMIYTGYFTKLKNYAEYGLMPVSIANNSPSTAGGLAVVKFKLLKAGQRFIENFNEVAL
jgi:hypothetical protein